jgi:hypothetical protein
MLPYTSGKCCQFARDKLMFAAHTGQKQTQGQDVGLADGDIAVTDGHLLLNDGTRVTVRQGKVGA